MVDIRNYLFLAGQAKESGDNDREKSILEAIISEHDPFCLEAREGLVRIYLSERQYNLAEHHISFLCIHDKNDKWRGQLLPIIEYAFISTEITINKSSDNKDLFYEQVCILSLAAKFSSDINKKASFYMQLAKLHIESGNFSKAIDSLKMIAQQSKDYGTIRKIMGDVYKAMLKSEEADACYKEANLYDSLRSKK